MVTEKRIIERNLKLILFFIYILFEVLQACHGISKNQFLIGLTDMIHDFFTEQANKITVFWNSLLYLDRLLVAIPYFQKI